MKVYNYVVTAMGLMLLMHFAGFPTGAMGELFDLVGLAFDAANEIQSVGFSISSFFNVIFQDTSTVKGILVTLGIAVGSVAAGLVTGVKRENLIIVPFITTVLVLFMSAFSSIINYSISNFENWITVIVLLIFLPFMVGFAHSLIQFFRGLD